MKKIYIVPNFVTTANMFCGFFSVVASTQKDYVIAAWAILAAAIFDMLDGRIARLAKATSQFGVEYDSLSDLISFGMAPGVLLYLWALQPYGRLGWLAAFLFTACGALRLARFNVNTGSLPKGFFQGLPIPMAAGTVATFIICVHALSQMPELGDSPLSRLASGLFAGDTSWRGISILALTLVLASLMVSTIRFPSFKELNWKSKASFSYLVIGVLLMILIAVKPEITLFLILIGYIVLSLAWNVLCFFRGELKPVKVKSIE